MVLSLAACNSTPAGNETNGDGEPALKPIKVGVLVADVSGEEALAFRAYYEKYLAPHYNVTLT